MEKIVRASIQHCLSPFETLSHSETSHPTLPFAIIPVYRASIIVVNFSGHPYFLSGCRSPVLPTVSNALLMSTNAIYSGRSCSLYFSCSCRRQTIISMVLRLPLKSHCVSGTSSGVLWGEFWRIYCLLSKEERLLYSSNSLFHHLSFRWLQCWHPSTLLIHNTPPRHWWLLGAVCWTDWLLFASILQLEFHLHQVLCHRSGRQLL